MVVDKRLFTGFRRQSRGAFAQAPAAGQRAHRHRNKIERSAAGKSARNLLSAVCLIAAIYFWLN
jgi:hypothetical protein